MLSDVAIHTAKPRDKPSLGLRVRQNWHLTVALLTVTLRRMYYAAGTLNYRRPYKYRDYPTLRTPKMRCAIALLASLFLAVISANQAEAAPNPQLALQGLLTGDAKIDRALIEAFRRGYQRGQEDEARSKLEDEARSKLPEKKTTAPK